jgi:hypothetical protein
MAVAAHVPPVSETEDVPHLVVVDPMTSLINEKASTLLRMTGQEFSHAWYAGQFTGSTDPAVVALDNLMRTGSWNPPTPITES